MQFSRDVAQGIFQRYFSLLGCQAEAAVRSPANIFFKFRQFREVVVQFNHHGIADNGMDFHGTSFVPRKVLNIGGDNLYLYIQSKSNYDHRPELVKRNLLSTIYTGGAIVCLLKQYIQVFQTVERGCVMQKRVPKYENIKDYHS